MSYEYEMVEGSGGEEPEDDLSNGGGYNRKLGGFICGRLEGSRISIRAGGDPVSVDISGRPAGSR